MIHPPCIRRDRSPRSRGSALVLVIFCVAIATVIGVTFLTGSATVTAVTETMTHHAQARQIAESGVMLAVRYVEQTPDWHAHRDSGVWVSEYAIDGGTCTVTGTFDAGSVAGVVTVGNASFEQATGQLATPVLNPPMSGTIGGWSVQRTALVHLLGATVPLIGVTNSAAATDGGRVGYIQFPLSIAGTATFRRTLADELDPDSAYTLKVDTGTGGLALLLADVQVRVYAGATLVASSSDPTLLTILDLAGTSKQYTLSFATDGNPPAGNVSIELHAQSLVGAVSAAVFDHVRFTREPTEPLVLTATAHYGDASHRVTAQVFPSAETGPASIVKWTEP